MPVASGRKSLRVHHPSSLSHRSSFPATNSSFIVLLVLMSYVPARAQDGNRFVRWTFQDGLNLIAHKTPTMLLLGAGGAVIIAGGAQVDKDISEEVQKQFDGHEFYLSAANALGTPPAVLGPVALFGLSTAIGNRRLQDAAFTSLEAIAYAGTTTLVAKEVIGRYRPADSESAKKFDPFSGNTSTPSGHATIVFAMFTPFVYYYPHPATYALFAVGVTTDLARIALNRHWSSDVVVGSGIGFLMARYLSRRHLSEAAVSSAVSITPLISPNAAGVHLTLALNRPQ